MAVDVRKFADELIERGETLAPRLNEFIPHSAEFLLERHPKQALFIGPLVTPIREAFYGGAAGGGKSEALLMAALQFADVPGYAAVIVRETYPMLSLEGGLIERSHQWLGRTDATWNQGLHRWSFPSGASLTFKHLTDSRAIRDYQGGEYQFIGVDEVTDFAEDQYRLLFSRLRAKRSIGVPLRVRCASNPTGPGKEWVHQRFVVAGSEAGRVFIPSRLEDNPELDIAEYERSLHELGSVEYERLRLGNWDAKDEGHMFKRAWFEIVSPADVPSDVNHVRYWDLAATETPEGRKAKKQGDPDWTVGLLLARSTAGIYYVDHVERFRRSPHVVEQRVRETAEEDTIAVPIRMEQEGGASGPTTVSHYRRNILDGFDFKGVRVHRKKEIRAAPVAARSEAGEVKLVRGPWIEAFLDEISVFPDGLHDDQVDALSGAFTFLAPKRAMGAGVRPQQESGRSYWLDR